MPGQIRFRGLSLSKSKSSNHHIIEPCLRLRLRQAQASAQASATTDTLRWAEPVEVQGSAQATAKTSTSPWAAFDKLRLPGQIRFRGLSLLKPKPSRRLRFRGLSLSKPKSSNHHIIEPCLRLRLRQAQASAQASATTDTSPWAEPVEAQATAKTSTSPWAAFDKLRLPGQIRLRGLSLSKPKPSRRVRFRGLSLSKPIEILPKIRPFFTQKKCTL
jgi:hypothetical protein